MYYDGQTAFCMSITIQSSVTDISKIGKALANKLKKLGIATVADLLTHYPFRYDDFTAKTAIAALQPGMKTRVEGTLEFIQNKRTPRRRMMVTEGLLRDETGQLKLVWFNQPYIGRSLKTGDKLSVAGLAQADFAGVAMNAPEYEKAGRGVLSRTAGLLPVYHTTANLTQKQLRTVIHSVLGAAAQLPEMVPDDVLRRHGFPAKAEAVRTIHAPADQPALERARRRLQFEELFLAQVRAQARKQFHQRQPASPVPFDEAGTKALVERLTFQLTNAQKKAAWDIIRDMQKNVPMARLLEGDVGSGKTVTAALAMYNAARAGRQSALMVPTEILAAQHFESLTQLFAAEHITVGLCTRTQQVIQHAPVNGHTRETVKKKEMLQLIKQRDVAIVVGTHALVQENVTFRDLALAIIDEQHRFGVEQRRLLREKSGNSATVPHLLSMTATPIPRTLAQAVYGDLDISIIDELPAGRKPVKTYVVAEHKRRDAYQFIRAEIKRGRQAFVVCPLISASDKLGVKSVEEEYKKLNEEIFPDLKIEYLHGRLKSADKDAVMQRFLKNDTQILVSTSVIEVGVDVPNATLMIIEGAERFGLSQLHQFRGRVGRSDMQSYCLLFADAPSEQSQDRLHAFARTTDGFRLAEEDLKLRGPGEVYGTAQKGFPEFKIARFDDYALLALAKEAAGAVVAAGLGQHPELAAWVRGEGEWVVG